MSEQKFDPMTGQPINQANPGGFKFDPMTGQPINQTVTEGTKFDPMTGQPINQTVSEGTKFDPMTGQPVNQQAGTQAPFGAESSMGTQPTYGGQTYGGQTYGAQQSFGGQQPGAFGYDPAAIEKANSDKNKKVAFVVLGVLAVAVLALLIVGAIKLKSFVASNKDDSRQDVVEEVQPDLDVPEEPVQPEKPAEPEVVEDPEVTEEPIQEEPEQTPVEEAGPETPIEEPASEPVEEKPDQAVATDRAGVDASALFAFQAGDFTYQLPEKVSDFEADGWTFNSEKEASTLIGAGDKEYMYLYYPGTDTGISVWLTNFSLDAQEARACYVTQIDLSDYDAKEIGKVTLKNGAVVLGETKEADLLTIYGEPSRVSESSMGNSYYYYDDSTDSDSYTDSYLCFNMSEDGILEILTVSNEAQPESFEQVEVSDEVPDYISQYVAPSSLGTDPFSGNFKLDGVVYNLPVPLKVLEDNGWTYDADADYVVGAGQGYVITIEKLDRKVCIVTSNFAEKATYLKNTMVVSVSVDPDGLFGNGMEFPGDLNANMTETELLAYMTKQNITNYDYYKETGTYTIPFDQTGKDRSQSGNKYQIMTDEGKISSIDFTCYGWLRQ